MTAADGNRLERIRRLFDDVVDLPTGERAAFLATAGETDRAMLAEVEELVAASRLAPEFLERPAAESELEGQMAGPWRIETLLASGGMADVYHAVRDDVDARLERRRQGAQARSRRRAAFETLPRRAARARRAQSSEHRGPARRRHHRRRTPLSRDGADRRRPDRPLLRGPASRHPRAPVSLPSGLRGGAARSSTIRRALRPQALERPRDARRRPEAPRFRDRDAARTRGAAWRDAESHHAGLREPGTTAWRRRIRDDRRLEPGRHALRARGGAAAVRRRRAHARRSSRGAIDPTASSRFRRPRRRRDEGPRPSTRTGAIRRSSSSRRTSDASSIIGRSPHDPPPSSRASPSSREGIGGLSREPRSSSSRSRSVAQASTAACSALARKRALVGALTVRRCRCRASSKT